VELLALPVGLALLVGLPFLYCRSQYRAIVSWSGPYQIAAGLPVCLWLLWLLRLGVDLSHDPTSHNLFPLEIAIYATASLIYLGMVAAVRRLVATVA
jgi:hypothetical protein